MKKLFLVATLNLSLNVINAQVSQEWVRPFTGGSLAPWNKGLTTDNAGNIYVAGNYSDGSVTAMLLQKYDAAGNLVWTENYLPVGSTSASARAMVIDSNGDILVSGVINNSSHFGFTRKYDPNGQLLWSQSTTYSNYSLTTDEFNNVYVTSWDFPQDSIKINKYDAAGNLLWTTTNNNTSTGGGHGKIFYKGGFLYRTGGIWVKFSARNVPVIYTIKYNASTGAQVWAKTYCHADRISQGGWDLVADAGGNVYVSGYVYVKAGKNQNTNWLTLKYNSAGTQQWAIMYDGNGNDNSVNGFQDSPIGMTMDNSGNIIICGTSYTTTGAFSSQDMTTIKYNSAGSPVWVRTYDTPGHGNDAAVAIITDASSNIYITGRTNATTIKYNPAGAQQWIMNYSGSITTNAYVDNTGNVYAGGNILIKYAQGVGPITKPSINHREIISNVNLYPNPAINQVVVRSDKNKILGTLFIHDASGKIVYQQYVGNFQAVIDVQSFSPGVYYLRFDQMEKAIKFIKH